MRTVLRDDLVDRDVPGDVPDGDDRRLLAGVELDQPAGPVVAEPRDDDPVARLEAGAGVGDRVGLPGLVLELGEAAGEGLAGPLGFGLGLQGTPRGPARPPCGASGGSPSSGIAPPRRCDR